MACSGLVKTLHFYNVVVRLSGVGACVRMNKIAVVCEKNFQDISISMGGQFDLLSQKVFRCKPMKSLYHLQFLYARLKNRRIMPWQCPSVRPSV